MVATPPASHQPPPGAGPSYSGPTICKPLLLSPLPTRLTPLTCGLNALGGVVGAPGDEPHRLAEADGFERWHMARARRHFLHDALGHRCALGQPGRQRVSFVEQRLVGDDPPDQSHRMGSLRVDALAGEQELHGIRPVDALWQAYRCDDRRHSEVDLRQTKLGSVTGDDEVTPGRQREPVTKAVAVHRRYDRLEDLPAALEGVQRRLLPERTGELAN